MKKYILSAVLALGILAVPASTLAAGLTTQQANSLIAVVQSAPGVPASAFINLITSFSNITTNQATSLITVVQSVPGASPSAFVNLLISFTADSNQPTQPSSIAVTLPHAGNNYKVGDSIVVNWNAIGFTPTEDNTQLILSGADGSRSVMYPLTTSPSSFFGPVPPVLSGNYTVSVCDYGPRSLVANPNPICGNSAQFSITDINIPGQKITVLSPNGGESWQTGKTYHITWSYANLKFRYNQILVSLVNSAEPIAGGGWNQIAQIAALSATTTDCYWTIPSYIPAASDYRIQVGQSIIANRDMSDVSDASFSIVSSY